VLANDEIQSLGVLNMICNLCTNVRIKPVDYFLKSDNHVHIVLNEKNIHLLHFNKSNTDNEPQFSRFNKENTTFIVEQPTLTESNNKASQIQQSDFNGISNTKVKLNYFSQLFESSQFTRRRSNGFYVLEGLNSVGYSIIYRNRIKLDDFQVQQQELCSTNAHDEQLNKESITSVSQQNNKKSLPLLFYIHGVGGNAKIWLHQIEYFQSKGYEIIAIDLLGHGKSSCPKQLSSYQFLEMALDVLLIFDMFCKSDNVVIGHSYGCSFSTYLAQNRKNAISKLILISGGSPHPLDFKNPLLDAPICLIRLIKPLLKCHFFW
jgi:predicted alpha/beta-fold hydrolase